VTFPSDQTAQRDGPPVGREDLVLPLHVEEVSVTHRRTDTAIVRVALATALRDRLVDETLTHERVDIRHVPVGRYVDEVPPPRQDGDVLIMPVVEEVLVFQRRLMLREEVHMRRVHVTEQHVELVALREQMAVVTRHPPRDADAPF